MAYDNNRQGGGQAPRKKPKAAVDLQKLAMSVPCPTAQGKFSSLMWGVNNDNISMTLYTNDPDDNTKENNFGKIKTAMQVPTFFGFLSCLDQAIRAKGEFKMGIEGLNWFGFGGQRRDTPKVDNELFIGKDANGLMAITLTAPNRPKIVFNFAPKNITHRFKHGDGSILTDGETSVMYAKAYHQMLTQLVTNDMLSKLMMHAKPGDFEPPPPPYQPGGGGGYGGGAQGGNRQGGQGGNSGGGNNYGNRREGGDSASPAASARAPAPAVNDDDDIPY